MRLSSRYHQDPHPVVFYQRTDGNHQRLLPDRTAEKISGNAQDVWIAVSIGVLIRGYYPVLLLLFHPSVHRIRERRYSFGSYLCLPDHVAAGQRGCRRHVSRLIRPEGDTHLRHQWHLVGHDRRLRPWPHAPHALSERLGKQIQAHSSAQAEEWEKDHTRFIDRLPTILRDAWRIVSGVLVYILIGIGIGAFMHGFVPEGFFEQYMSKDNWYAVPLSVILAVPMYANAAGIVPVIEVFVAKGIPLGTAIAFMMAVVGLSLPEATLLKKVMTWRLIGIFFGTVAFFIILSGYLFNYIL